MTTLREAAQQALEALEYRDGDGADQWKADVITALRAALAQEQAEPVVGIIESKIKVDSHQTLDDAMQQPRAMAQAYESGYKAGQAHEREACAKVCDPEPSPPNEAYTVLNNKATMRRCAATIRARGNT